jgi:hypothetical protein
MERVAFLVERTGERIECLLNPDSFVLARQAGVRTVRSLAGTLSGRPEADDALLATGGGSTELVLELLFDVSKQSSPRPEASVQALTAPLWALAENSSEGAGAGLAVPPQVRFVWGKSWNLLATVVSVAERFEQFTPEGMPRRSWVKLRLLRCAAEHPVDAPLSPLAEPQADLETLLEAIPEDEVLVHEVAGSPPDDADAGQVDRIDQLAARYLGEASAWRLLAAFNGLDDPSRMSAGTLLRVPASASR